MLMPLLRRRTFRAGKSAGLAATVVCAMSGGATAQDANRVIRWQGDGLRLEMAALSREQIEAFFIGRGFEPAAAVVISADGCVFRSNIGQLSDRPDALPLTSDLAAWRVSVNGVRYELRTRNDWAPVWQEKRIAPGPRTAFRWALFPTLQTFGPTDYNWGMITFGQPPGTRFDLKIAWRTGKALHETKFTGLECSK